MKKFASILLICILLTAGCSLNQDAKNNEGNIYTYPFTGLETDVKPDHRPIAVMVSNQSQARPQSGLSKADIVFELLAEGNITRFLALYHSEEPDVVGPVRSAREYYFELADRYHAIYVYHGAAKHVNKMIEEREIDHISGTTHDNDGQLFVREAFRKAPHNSYFQFKAAADYIASEGYEETMDIPSLPFLAPDEEIEGEEGTYAKIHYYANSAVVEYKYDKTEKKYRRINDGEETIELESEKPILIDNVLIIESDHKIIDKEDRRGIDLSSGGKAYLLQQGKMQEVAWKNEDGYIIPVKDGKPIPFVPGQTWINVVPKEKEKGVEEQVSFTK